MTNEPAVSVATVVSAVGAAITLAAAFGLHLSADQRTAILGFVTIVAPLVAGVLIRRKVSPVVSTDGPEGP